jgi:predicted nucleotidyltransferase
MTKGLETLPAVVRERLKEWTAALREALGDDLVGIVVHGSVARGEYRPNESDVDAVVVIHEPTLAKLAKTSNAMQVARYAARIEAMILTEEEISGASDAFPLLYDEIKSCHILVTGRDPFEKVVIHDTHRRLRIEQELREAQIRLRRAVTDAAGAGEAVGGAVARKVKQVRGALHALLALKGETCEADLASVVEKAGKVWAVDVTAIATSAKAREAPEPAHAALVELLAKAIADVNRMPDGLAPASRGGTS